MHTQCMNSLHTQCMNSYAHTVHEFICTHSACTYRQWPFGRCALILLYLPKFKTVPHYAKFKNDRRILIGYWLAQELLAEMLYAYIVCMRVDVHCVWDQTGSKLGACDWPSLKRNRPQINNLAYEFPSDFQRENKETLLITEGLN